MVKKAWTSAITGHFFPTNGTVINPAGSSPDSLSGIKAAIIPAPSSKPDIVCGSGTSLSLESFGTFVAGAGAKDNVHDELYDALSDNLSEDNEY